MGGPLLPIPSLLHFNPPYLPCLPSHRFLPQGNSTLAKVYCLNTLTTDSSLVLLAKAQESSKQLEIDSKTPAA